MEEEKKDAVCMACQNPMSGDAHTCGIGNDTSDGAMKEGEDKKLCTGCGHEHGEDSKCTDNTCACA